MPTNNMDESKKLVDVAKILGIDYSSYGKDHDDLDDLYDEFLDGCYPKESREGVCGLSTSPSKLIKENDPTRYRCGKNDWLDSQTKEDILFDIGEQYLTADELETFKDDLKDKIDDLI